MDELGTVRDLLDEVDRWRARAASSWELHADPFVALRSSGTRVILVHGRGGVVQRWLGMCVLLSWYPARGLQLLRIGQKYLLNQRLISDRFAGRQIPVAAVGLLREPAVDAAEAAIVDLRVVYRERPLWFDRLDEVDRLRHLDPRSLSRNQERLDRLLGHVQRVAGMVDRLIHDVPEVRAVRLAAVDERVTTADRPYAKAGSGELLARGHPDDLQPWNARFGGGIDRHAEPGQAKNVYMVGVLVSHQHRVRAGQGSWLAPRPRIDDEHPAIALKPYARVSVFRDPHGA
jgi:hypothetical protein